MMPSYALAAPSSLACAGQTGPGSSARARGSGPDERQAGRGIPLVAGGSGSAAAAAGGPAARGAVVAAAAAGQGVQVGG